MMEKLKKILSNVLGIPESEITDETSPDNVETWDSFNGLMLVSELENEFNVKFTMDEVTSVKCVKDIKEALKKHGINLNESS
jgi:acyl carrier protein